MSRLHHARHGADALVGTGSGGHEARPYIGRRQSFGAGK